ncbi:hypothetical protein KC19_7G086600 [Ceratodon purpureus]|uniref:Uncharacterized protein n=1 Tax=Ceratodon purpureus TaxID=3225 RepID=A0A8T0H7L4_CERPU|nr:hypothetical protein KC19_7G086600 [Ceratodon purpureus]
MQETEYFIARNWRRGTLCGLQSVSQSKVARVFTESLAGFRDLFLHSIIVVQRQFLILPDFFSDAAGTHSATANYKFFQKSQSWEPTTQTYSCSGCTYIGFVLDCLLDCPRIWVYFRSY